MTPEKWISIKARRRGRHRIDKRQATLYSRLVIKTFRHKGLEGFFRTGSKAGIQPSHANKLRILLTALDAAEAPEHLSAPGWRLHGLTGNFEGFWSVTVNGNWRLIFRFDDTHVTQVDYLDYH
ncbi:type II toxin-antitoxin system RelE/ParE family toxin [Acidithiobacillus sp. IBUN Pt1247-S3]|uniref:type II toxin-antitoxin system RelE/ParE family toxin n=1 Tax=Acidithiobacillus sp. IBUN Pt1247-S3 TaxID=3166642 RepID=UPI0034E56821